MAEKTQRKFRGSELSPILDDFKEDFEDDDLFILDRVCRGTFTIRRTSQGAGPESTAITIFGDLKALAVADIISMLNVNRKTGVAKFVIPGSEKNLFFQNGEIVFATSSLDEDRLGESMVRSGKMTDRQLIDLGRKITPRNKLGKLMVESGLITPKELWMGVRRQVEEIVFSLFVFTEGIFYFHEGPLKTENILNLPMSTQNMIMEGVRRLDESRAGPEGGGKPGRADFSDDARRMRTRQHVEEVVLIMKSIFTLLTAKSPGVNFRNIFNTFFLDSHLETEGLFKEVLIDKEGGLNIDRVLENLSKMNASDPEKLVRKSFKELLFFELFEMKNFLTKEESEELSRIIEKVNSESI